MTSSSSPPHPLAFSPSHPLLWAVFLATSWTWCIGMFLPVLLVRDYGIWGWVVFAIPNVIGAAAMGWTVRDPEHSRRLVDTHRHACRLFSLITIAFQLYFAAWLIARLSLPWFFAALVLATFLWIIAPNRDGPGLIASAAVYAVSLACIAVGLAAGVIPKLPPAPAVQPAEIAALAVVCVFGFALCPYFDFTFHRARQAARGQAGSRLAFGLGFGVLFLLMILFTLGYSGVLTRDVAGVARWILLVHLSLQLALTGGLHMREAETGKGPTLALTIASITVFLLAVATMQGWIYRGIDLGEVIYRCFMSFYGLVFPAYAWMCMVPTWREPQRPTRRMLVVFAVATLLAAPFYYVAFIGQRMGWVVAGVAVVLLARLFLGRRRGEHALA